jgi:hypothetical protein
VCNVQINLFYPDHTPLFDGKRRWIIFEKNYKIGMKETAPLGYLKLFLLHLPPQSKKNKAKDEEKFKFPTLANLQFGSGHQVNLGKFGD